MFISIFSGFLLPMSSDFIFVNSHKIPPRRAANSGVSGKVKIRKIKSPAHQNDNDEWEVPEFDLLGESSQIYLAGFEAPTADPLTQAIFRNSKIRGPSLFESPPAELSKVERNMARDLESVKNSRRAILAELESIDNQDAELAKKFQRVELPHRSTRADLISSPRDGSTEDEKKSAPIKLNIISPEESGETFSSPELDRFRAESDWFRVSLAAPERIFELKEIARRRAIPRLAEENNKNDEIEPDGGHRFKIRTYLAVFSALVAPLSAGVFLFSGKDNFVASAFNSFNAKLLSTSSFTLVNSEESNIFPELVEINSYLKSRGLDQPADAVTRFIEDNSSFGWLNFFKKKDNFTSDSAGGFGFKLKSLEFLDEAESVLASPVLAREGLDNVYQSLKNYIDWLNFWDQLTSPEKHYLIAVADAAKAWPGGGRLESYALVKTETGGLETLASGKFSVLDAALNLKIVPPEPIKLVSTAWLPSQSLWFLDFKESAKTLINFFENTTQKKVDGVIVVDKDFLKKLSFKESLLYDADSANWFYGLSEALARKPNIRWTGLAEHLKQGLDARQIQFYFKDNVLEKFAEDSGWLFSAGNNQAGDFLGVSAVSLEGASPALELIEYKINVFEDGSAIANLNLMLKQPVAALGQNYFKIYLPKNSQILKAEGFSQKEKLPEFDYSVGGFSSDARIARGAAIGAGPGGADIFEESGLAVAAGWVQLKNGSRNTLSLEYLLPFKLSRRAASADYRLKVLRPRQNQDAPFRFVLVPQKEIRLASLEPNGFVTQNLGEYQGNLTRDLNLTATFLFGD